MVFAIVIAVSNAIPIELGHYASPVYAPVAKAILPEPVVSVVVVVVFKLISLAHMCDRDYFYATRQLEWRKNLFFKSYIIMIMHAASKAMASQRGNAIEITSCTNDT